MNWRDGMLIFSPRLTLLLLLLPPPLYRQRRELPFLFRILLFPFYSIAGEREFLDFKEGVATGAKSGERRALVFFFVFFFVEKWLWNVRNKRESDVWVLREVFCGDKALLLLLRSWELMEEGSVRVRFRVLNVLVERVEFERVVVGCGNVSLMSFCSCFWLVWDCVRQ